VANQTSFADARLSRLGRGVSRVLSYQAVTGARLHVIFGTVLDRMAKENVLRPILF